MTYMDRFPKSLRWTPWAFRTVSKLWHTDKIHPDDCKCEGCFLGSLQLELKL